MQNRVTLIRPIWLWLLRVAWVTLPLTAGPAATAGLRDWSDAPRIVAEILLWLGWAAGLLATVAPRPATLTALRAVAPAFAVFAIAAVVEGQPSTIASIGAVSATIVTAVLASGHDIALAAANAVAYGDEQRVPLRVPPALFLAPIPIARALVVAAVVSAPLLFADGQVVLGLIAFAVGVPIVVVLGRALHGLSRRWTVLVPAGFVVVDRFTLADPVLFLRERITTMSAVAPGPAPAGALDLRLGATLGSLVLRFSDEAELFRAVRRRESETVRARGICIAVVRRDDMLRAAASRRLPVRDL
jgi:hypothetical protein